MTAGRTARPLPAPILWVAGCVYLLAWFQLLALDDPRAALGRFYGWFGATCALYLAMLWMVRRAEAAAAPWRLSLGFILVIAALARWIMLEMTPTLSDDLSRYQWDARVGLAGLDPYAFAPAHPALKFLRDSDFTSINFPHVRTTYPFLTQLAFRLGIVWGGTFTSMKLVFVLAEVLTCAALLVLLVQRHRSPLWIVAYAWHPLAILEVAGSGHNDALGIAWLWVGFAAWQLRGWVWAVVAWVAAFLSKFLSVIILPWWAFRKTFRGWIGVFVLMVGLPFLLHPTATTALIETLSAMAGRSTANGLLYVTCARLLGRPMVVALLLAALWLAFTCWWARRQDDVLRYSFGVFIAAALLAPTLHPWYLLWWLPFFCFWRIPALLALSGTVVLTYTSWPGYLAGGPWTIPTWARLAQYLPVAILALWELRRLLPKRQPTAEGLR